VGAARGVEPILTAVAGKRHLGVEDGDGGKQGGQGMNRLVQECRMAVRPVPNARPTELVQKLVQSHLVQKKSQVPSARNAI
jgi:hypothetical protein